MVPDSLPCAAALAFEMRCRRSANEPECPCLVRTLGARHDVTTASELLERKNSDRFLSQCPCVARLGGLEEIARDLAQPFGAHAPAVVIEGDDGIPPAASQNDSNPRAISRALGILVSGVRDELVQRVLRILVRLPGDQHGLRKVADPEAHFLGGHQRIVGGRPDRSVDLRSPRRSLLARYRDGVEQRRITAAAAPVGENL